MLEVNFECGTIEDIKRMAYEEGVNDAFDAARKIESSLSNGGYTTDEIYRLFPDRGDDGLLLDIVLDKYSPMAIVSIVQNYEEEKAKELKELRVGDVIKTSHCCGIITKIDNHCNEYKYCILWRDGSVGHHKYEYLIKDKTDENMTIPEFFEKYRRVGE